MKLWFKKQTILCNWLVCNLPLSPKLLLQTISNFPIFVALCIIFGSFNKLICGFKQYKYCLLQSVSNILTDP